jgi:hypothetical protein
VRQPLCVEQTPSPKSGYLVTHRRWQAGLPSKTGRNESRRCGTERQHRPSMNKLTLAVLCLMNKSPTRALEFSSCMRCASRDHDDAVFVCAAPGASRWSVEYHPATEGHAMIAPGSRRG